MGTYTRFKSAVVAKKGFYVGDTGSEQVIFNSAGTCSYGVGFPIYAIIADTTSETYTTSLKKSPLSKIGIGSFLNAL